MTQQTKQGDAYVQLARQTIDEYVRTGRQIQVPSGLPEEMYETRAGVFVSIKIKDSTSQEGSAPLRLRGCIGTIQAVQPSIAQELIHNAVSAASRTQDFRRLHRRSLQILRSAWMCWARWSRSVGAGAGCEALWRSRDKRIPQRAAAAKPGWRGYRTRAACDRKAEGGHW